VTRAIADPAARWRAALTLPGEPAAESSGVGELATYFGLSRDEARRPAESPVADSRVGGHIHARAGRGPLADRARGVWAEIRYGPSGLAARAPFRVCRVCGAGRSDQ